MGIVIWLSAWALLSFIISRKTKSLTSIIGGGLLASIFMTLIIFFIDESLFADSTERDVCAIAQEFSKNELAAIAKYDGKWLTIKGVAGVKGDSAAGLFMQFPCGKFWPATQCFFKKSKALELSRISPGQTVLVKGRCKGKLLGILMFDKCSIVTN